MTETLLGHDRFLIEQSAELRARYSVTALGGEEAAAAALLLASEKHLKLHREIEFARPGTDARPTFRLVSREGVFVSGMPAAYDVLDEEDRVIGGFVNRGPMLRARTSWWLFDEAERPTADVRERRFGTALLRRFGVPLRLEVELQSGPLRLGTIEQQPSLRDRYVLDLSPDRGGRIDPRIAIALVIALDRFEHR